MATTIHTARAHLAEPLPDGQSVQDFVSLDGEHWLPINRPATKDDASAIAALFEGDDHFKPMTYARRAVCWGATHVEWGEVTA